MNELRAEAEQLAADERAHAEALREARQKAKMAKVLRQVQQRNASPGPSGGAGSVSPSVQLFTLGLILPIRSVFPIQTIFPTFHFDHTFEELGFLFSVPFHRVVIRVLFYALDAVL